MSYTMLDPQPAPRAADAEPVAPGLWPNEVAVQLDTGSLVAVYAEVKWLDNNFGAEFYASARYINADGSTKLCAFNQEVVTESKHCCDSGTIALYGVLALSKEHILLLLGEPPTMVTKTNPDNSTFQAPMIDWSDEVRANCSVRHAISIAEQAGEVTNLGSLL